MKIYFNGQPIAGAWGGGNQFQKCLKKYLKNENLLTDIPSDADIIFFNSHQDFKQIINLKSAFPDKKFIHRVDGPMKLYNNMSDNRDDIVYYLNNSIADATVFQSNYSFDKNIEMGMKLTPLHTVIYNSVDSDIFFKKSDKKKGEKTNLIAASWSPNIRKGFNYYQFLDENLDFSKYNFSFAGQSPIKFTNVKNLGILNSEQLAVELRASSIYLTASENDPCSNSLIEALACGIPVIALNSGGHPELVKEGGLLFEDNNDLLDKIECLNDNYEQYSKNIEFESITSVANKYISFFKEVK